MNECMSNSTPTLFDDFFEASDNEDLKPKKQPKKKDKKAAEPSAASMSLFGELEIFDKEDVEKIQDIDDNKVATEKIEEDKELLDKQIFAEAYQDFFAADAILGPSSKEDKTPPLDTPLDVHSTTLDEGTCTHTENNEFIDSKDDVEIHSISNLASINADSIHTVEIAEVDNSEDIPIHLPDETAVAPSMDASTDSIAKPLEDPLNIELEEWTLDKNYYTIGMVAKMFDVNISHIRFWTNEFNLKPRTNRKGDRLYTPTLINTLRLIHYLVKVQKHTIKGAKEKLAGRKKAVNANLTLKQQLEALKHQLTSLRNNID